MSEKQKVYECINQVQAELASMGISKSKENKQQNYKFRGIDDVYNVASPLFAKHHLSIFPRVISRDCVERMTKSSTAIFYVTVYVEFDIVCSLDGSSHKVSVYGEASDMADKATNKAMSAAMKYMCLMTFMIPTEGEEDADAVTHDAVLISSNKSEKRIENIEGMVLDAKIALEECKTLDELKFVFGSLRDDVKKRCVAVKDAVKNKLIVPADISKAFPEAKVVP